MDNSRLSLPDLQSLAIFVQNRTFADDLRAPLLRILIHAHLTMAARPNKTHLTLALPSLNGMGRLDVRADILDANGDVTTLGEGHAEFEGQVALELGAAFQALGAGTPARARIDAALARMVELKDWHADLARTVDRMAGSAWAAWRAHQGQPSALRWLAV